MDCSGLNSVVIPNNVTSIGVGAFSGCSGLASIVVESGNAKYDSRNDCNAIIETVTNTLIAGCKNTAIPNSVTSIGNYAFYGCSGLASVKIPNSVMSIGNYAFCSCSGLNSVVVPNSVTTIGNYAFCSCSNLSYVTIGERVNRIEKFAFCSTQKLKSIKLLCSTPPTLSDYPFPTFESYTATLEVPIGSKDSYQNAEIWKKFMNIEEFDPTGVQSITLDKDIKASVYDLNGRRLTAPTKGINIIGGKKILNH